MKSTVFLFLIAVTQFCFPTTNFGQAPNLGSAADFVLFTTVGAVTNTGISQLTGSVGSNSGSSTGFGNVNGVMQNNNLASAQAAADLLIAYNQLNTAIPDFFPAPLLGNGQTLVPGVYSLSGPSTLNGGLTLNAQGNPAAVFIFQIQGAFSAAANSKIHLMNGAQACNVFWKVEGLVSMAAGTTMRGSIVANNAAINMNAGDTLEGRALSTTGAITVNGVMAYTPIGCGSPYLTGPAAPSLGSTACYALFSSSGPVSNTGITTVTGDVGTNVGLTTGFDPLLVNGTIHPIPDGSTSQAASDLLNTYSYLNGLQYDIELLYPEQFGNNLVLTPHTYLLNAATTLTDTLYLNAQGNPNAVFVMKIYGALSTSTYSRVILMNGTQAKNVFWQVNGATDISDYSIFKGTIVGNNGALNIRTGVSLEGSAFTTTGALSTEAITSTMTPGCSTASSPEITTQPGNQNACAGTPVSFSVVATGSNLTYQWRKGSVNLSNGGAISGAQSATLTIDPVSTANAGMNYNVVITGTTPPSITSINAGLVVKTAPSIFSQPSDQSAGIGGTASFSVTAFGSDLTYQWRKGSVNLVNAGNISGANSATLTISPVGITDPASNYNVVITGSCSPAITSTNVSLTIANSPVIASQPSNQTACVGSPASFSVVASGAGLTYQWRKGTLNLTNSGNISGANTATLTIFPVSNADAALNYNVVVTGTNPPAVTSNNAALVVNTAPVISTQPSDQFAAIGGTASFSVTALGSDLTYQWRKGSVNLVNGGNISGANSATLTISPVGVSDPASNYNVVITGACSPAITSTNVSLDITNSPVIASQPLNQTACVGSSASFSVVASGAGLTYQWRKGTLNLSNGGNISGATSAILTINPVSNADAAMNYNVVITGTYPPAVTSNNAALVVNTAPVISTQPSDQFAAIGGTASFSVTALGSDLTYQWRKGSVNLVNGGNISGANSATLTISPVGVSDPATNYNVVITGSCSPAVTSTNVSLDITNSPVIASQPLNQTACVGSPVSFSVVASGAGLTYQWRKGTVNLSNGGNISGATSAILTINPVSNADAAMNYNVVITGTYPPAITSNNAGLVVKTPPTIFSQPSDQSTGIGGTASFSVTALGSDLTYQWRKGIVNLINGGNISGANSATLTISPVGVSDPATNYNVVITGSCSPAITTTNVSLDIDDSPVIASQPLNQTACVGSSVSFSVIASGAGLTYQWRKGTVNLSDGGNISGATSANLTISPVSSADAAMNYHVVITGTFPPAAISNDVELEVKTAPIIVTEPINQTAEIGTSVSFTVVATGSNLLYRWRKGSVNLSNGGNISGATSATLTINPMTVTDTASNYNVVISGYCFPMAYSESVYLSIVTGIDPINLIPAKAITLYPNPFTSSFNVEVSEFNQEMKLEIRIYSLQGQEIMRSRLINNVSRIETANLQPGSYFYNIFDDNKSIKSGIIISD